MLIVALLCAISLVAVGNPSAALAPVPNPDDVTSNPLGSCNCNGQLWVSEGCSYGFYCDDTTDIGGYLRICNEVCKLRPKIIRSL